jgi:hypothetical protein
MADRYWVHHPLMRPWARAYVGQYKQVPNWTACTLFYPRVVNAGTEDEGVVHEIEHFLEKTEAEAIATMKAWIEKAFGPGVRMRLMPRDEPDYR